MSTETGNPTELCKRRRVQKLKPGQLKARWANLEGEPDFYAFTFDKADERHAKLVIKAFCSGRYNQLEKCIDASFLQQLESLGYDLDTLRFSIEKKQKPEEH